MNRKPKNNKPYILARYISIGISFIILSNQYIRALFRKIILNTVSLITPTIKTNIEGINLVHQNVTLTISNACVGIEAYMLLSLLIFSTPMSTLLNNLITYIEAVSIITVINILRIAILFLLITKAPLIIFDKIHMALYDAINGIILAATVIYLFRKKKIKERPIISDIHYLIKSITQKNQR